MVASTSASRMSSTSAAGKAGSKIKSSSHFSTSSPSSSLTSRTTTKSSSATLVASSVKKATRSGKAKKSNKFRDSEKREQLDGETAHLFAQQPGGAAKKSEDPFSYNLPSQADQRRTRAQVDEAALALDLLMKS